MIRIKNIKKLYNGTMMAPNSLFTVNYKSSRSYFLHISNTVPIKVFSGNIKTYRDS